jgi:hypothetical protein
MVKIIDHKNSRETFKHLNIAGTCIIRGIFNKSDCENIASKLELLGLGSGSHIINPDREQHLIAQVAEDLASLQHLEKIQYLKKNTVSLTFFTRSHEKQSYFITIIRVF